MYIQGRLTWTAIGAVEVNKLYKNKDLLLFAQVVQTNNMIISRRYFAEDSTRLF